MKIIIPKRTRQRGATLIEVMLAGLVLTVGGVSYMRLQQIGLQSSFNDYARTQATSVAQGFVDSLRGNIKYLNLSKANSSGFLIGGKVAAVKPPQSDTNCTSATPGKACALATLNYHRYLTSLRLGNALPSGNSILCYQQSADRIGYVRVSVQWKDNNSKDKTAFKDQKDCPAAKFDSKTKNEHIDNSVTIYAQL